jgi:MFS family permease
MKRGFYTILAAQFFSALADNALLFAAIALLKLMSAPGWQIPVLQQSFIVSFILLAPFVGAFADSLPKGRVMFISNAIKMAGCLAMLAGVNPLLAYGLAGFGAAAYSPAKYGILTEFLPPEKLVLANSWMEGLTVAAIILGAVLGGVLLSPNISEVMLHWWDVPLIDTGIDTAPELAIAIIFVLYSVAALFNLYIPRIPIDHKPLSRDPAFLVKEFSHCFKLLWKDPLGQVSLGVTTLFWGAGASLRLILLAWAAVALHYDMSSAAKLTAWFAVGIAIGSVLAARYVKLEHAVKVLPVGIGMGVMVMMMTLISSPVIAIILLIGIGAMGGFFVVPMNALLQHRGHLLMGAGSSIAVQNFNENISIFVMLGIYALMEKMGFTIYSITVVFGLLMAGIMTVLYKKHGHDQDSGKI